MRRLTSLLFLCSFVTTVANAQTLVFSQNKCALDKQDEIRRMADSLWMPVASAAAAAPRRE
jgi:hypothetical protein